MPERWLGRTGEGPCVQDGAGTGWLAPSTVASKEGPGWPDHLLFFKKGKETAILILQPPDFFLTLGRVIFIILPPCW